MSEQDDEARSLLELLYLLPVGVVRCDLDGHIGMLNPRATALLMPLAVGGQLENLFAVLTEALPELRGLVRERVRREPGYSLDRLRFEVAEHGARPATWLELTMTQPTATDLMAVFTDVTELVQKEAMLRELARTDPLTGLLNRRSLRERVEDAIARRARHGDSLSFLLLDIDHFKAVNDEHGHDAGDEVLRLLAATLNRCTRDTDAVCRWGGEEFAVLCVADIDGARRTAERICQAVRQEPTARGGPSIPFTVSIGVVEHVAGEDLDTLCGRADEAMYRAKRAGRDRVEEG